MTLSLGAPRVTTTGTAGADHPAQTHPPSAGRPRRAPGRPAAPARAHAETSMAAGAEARAAVLLATTAPLLRRAMRAVLEDAGMGVLEAADGMGALLLHAFARPRVAVVDFRLPDMDGLDLTRRLRAMTPPVEVIIHTRASADAVAALAIAAGARAVIAWDSPPGVLLPTVHAALAAAGTTGTVRQ